MTDYNDLLARLDSALSSDNPPTSRSTAMLLLYECAPAIRELQTDSTDWEVAAKERFDIILQLRDRALKAEAESDALRAKGGK